MQRRNRFFILLVFSITCLYAGFVSAESEKIDFQQALALARARSPDFDVSKRLDKNAQLTYKNTWATLLPQIDIQAQHYYNAPVGSIVSSALSPTGLVTTQASPWSDLLALNVSENFYDNGDSFRLMKIADLSRESVRLDLTHRLEKLLLKVATAYYAFSQSVGNLELQKKEIETLRQEFRTIEGRYRQGVNSNRDYLRIKAQLQRSEVDFATQKISEEETIQALRVAIGVKEAVDFLAFTPDTQVLANLKFPSLMAEETIDYQIAHLQNKISDLKYLTVARQNWPRISLKSGYSYNEPQYIGPEIPGTSSYWNFQVALFLDYSLWDWGTRSRNVEIADNQRNIENDGQETIRIQVSQDLNKLGSQISFYKQSFIKSQQILKDEEDVYSSLNRGYRDGKVTYLELITALNDLYAARTQFLNLQFSLLNTRATLAFYQGNLDEVLSSH